MKGHYVYRHGDLRKYKTPYGVIEITHTKRSVSDILNSIYRSERPLRVATQDAAIRDLRRVGRNLHLLPESY
ncbi:TPA: hypothetical protein ACGWRI_005090 [Vibrio vulnificus]